MKKHARKCNEKKNHSNWIGWCYVMFYVIMSNCSGYSWMHSLDYYYFDRQNQNLTQMRLSVYLCGFVFLYEVHIALYVHEYQQIGLDWIVRCLVMQQLHWSWALLFKSNVQQSIGLQSCKNWKAVDTSHSAWL